MQFKSRMPGTNSVKHYFWVLAAAASLVASATGPAVAQATSPAPIKIGFLDTISGPLAEVGNDTLAGARIAVNQINAKGGVLGHPLQLVVKDEQLSPTVTVQDMRQFGSSGVHFVTGFTSSADCLAAVPVATQDNMAIVSSACSDDSLETTNFSPRLFTVASNTVQMARAAAHYVVQHYPKLKVWDNMSYDYITGHAFWTDFQTELKKLEPKVQFGKSVFVPFTATQMAPYITAVLASLPANSQKSYGLFMGTFGSGTIDIAQQGKPYGLFKRFALALNVSGSEPTSRALGPSGPRLTYVEDYYYQAYRNPMNSSFVSTYMKHNPTGPDAWVEQGYAGVQVIAQAIAHAKSTATAAVIKSLSSTQFSLPKGISYIRPQDHVMLSPETVWTCQGDKQSKIGYACTSWTAEPARLVAPPVYNHK